MTTPARTRSTRWGNTGRDDERWGDEEGITARKRCSRPFGCIADLTQTRRVNRTARLCASSHCRRPVFRTFPELDPRWTYLSKTRRLHLPIATADCPQLLFELLCCFGAGELASQRLIERARNAPAHLRIERRHRAPVQPRGEHLLAEADRRNLTIPNAPSSRFEIQRPRVTVPWRQPRLLRPPRPRSSAAPTRDRVGSRMRRCSPT